MQRKILDFIFNQSIKRGKAILIAMAIATVALGAFIPRLVISSSQQNLIPKDHPEQARYLKFNKEFGASDNLIIVLEGDSEILKAHADEFAAELKKQDKWVTSVFHKIDTSVLLKGAPLYIPVKDLEHGLELMKKNRAWLDRIQDINGLHSLLNLITVTMKEPNSGVSVDAAAKILGALNAVFEEWNQWIENPKQIKLKLAEKLATGEFSQLATLQGGGYLFSRDFKMLFILVQPKNYDDEITYLKPFIADMRAACDRVLAATPGLKDNIKVAFTGMPAYVHTQTEVIYEDVGSAGVLSVIIVSAVLLIGFRSIKKTVIAVIPTVSGIIIALGLITILIGRLNLISSSFLAVLFGIGIDFGIYLLQRTEEELGNGLKSNDAIYKSVVLTSRSIISGGLTTCFAFFALSMSRFAGYSELGLCAGIGLLVVMITTFVMMPSLLMLIPVEARDYHLRESITSTEKMERKKFHLVIIVVGFVVTAFSIYATTQLRMDYNVLKMMPRNTESTIYQQKMEDFSDFKTSFAMITDRNPARLEEVVAKVSKLPTVSRIDSLSQLIPSHQDEKLKIIKKIRPILGNFRIELGENSTSAEQYVAVLDKMTGYFEEAQEKAFSGGQKNLTEQIDKLLVNIDSIREALASDGRVSALARTKAFEKEVFANLEKATQIIRESVNPARITEKSFPTEIISRFKSAQGTYVAMVSPTGSIWDIKFLDRFVGELKSVTSEVTGFPVTHRVYVRQAADAIFEAMIYSFLIILLLLIIDFRRPAGVILALVPLALGMMWLQLVLYIFKIDYNVANIGGLPLLLGLGIVYGLRIMHRWREDTSLTAFAATKTTGRGLAFAALAIIVGLMSIVPARHKGVSDFGLILLIGIILCLATALFILPAIIDYLYHMKKDRDAAPLPAEGILASEQEPAAPEKKAKTAARAKAKPKGAAKVKSRAKPKAGKSDKDKRKK